MLASNVVVASKGKGPVKMLHRAGVIGTRYGLGPDRMERRLGLVTEVLDRYACEATFPITASAAKRNPRVMTRYSRLGIELAVHGYYHVDHTRLSDRDQLEHLGRARRLLEWIGVPTVGFRAPYLRWNEGTLSAVRENGFLYDSSQAVNWPIDPRLETDAYRRALAFYGAVPSGEHPVVPWSDHGVVRIPYCLPDDEAVVDRLRLTPEAIAELWTGILRATYERGELFTLGIHPERIELCAPAVAAVLEDARAARPPFWIARADEIARWWRDRATSTVVARWDGPARLRVGIRGPKGLTVLARELDVPAARQWADGYLRVRETEFDVMSERRPFIAVHPSSPISVRGFLREQGYIVEVVEHPDEHSYFVERERFTRADARSLLAELERSRFPLLRLGRWPDGARAALSVTGDVDALTIWDYAFRFLGR